VTLAKRLVRAMSWTPWLPVAGIAALLAWSITNLRPDFQARNLHLRAGLLLAALGLSFAFDDTAAATTDPAPSQLRKRRLLRMLIALAPWSVVVLMLMWSGTIGGLAPTIVLTSPQERPELPVGRLVLEGATLAAWGLALAALISSRWDNEPGKFASASLLALYAVTWMLPETRRPWAVPSDSQWLTAHFWWWVALGVGVFFVVAFSWDSRRRSTLSRLRRLHSRPSVRSGDTHATRATSLRP